MQKGTIRDKNVVLLAGIAGTLQADYLDDGAAWIESPFAWIKTRPSRQVGKIGEQLVAGFCAAKGLNVLRSSDSDADRIIEDRRVEIKLSTLWRNGSYVFQQIRDQRYDTLLCLGLSPFDAHAWVIDKRDIPFGRLAHQHGGVRGTDTWWLQIDPKRPPTWLKNHPGTLASIEVFQEKTRSVNVVSLAGAILPSCPRSFVRARYRALLRPRNSSLPRRSSPTCARK